CKLTVADGVKCFKVKPLYTTGYGKFTPTVILLEKTYITILIDKKCGKIVVIIVIVVRTCRSICILAVVVVVVVVVVKNCGEFEFTPEKFDFFAKKAYVGKGSLSQLMVQAAPLCNKGVNFCFKIFSTRSFSSSVEQWTNFYVIFGGISLFFNAPPILGNGVVGDGNRGLGGAVGVVKLLFLNGGVGAGVFLAGRDVVAGGGRLLQCRGVC
uniref:Uncharacterized protein n=1 Tax=Romanomermis culicivorax TaxID=13658 RepID=A0A915JDK1_ROMCU